MKQRKSRGLPPPDFVANRPRLGIHLDFYMDAFEDLSTTRPVGFGVGPIPWNSLDAYARRYTVRDFERFNFLIRRMDDAFLRRQKQLEKNRGKS